MESEADAEELTDLDESDVTSAEVDWLLLLMESGHADAAAEQSCEMDKALWAKLPEDFLDRVLVRLPLVSHLKFRSVCKQWRATLSSPRFLRHRAALASCAPPICLCQIESGWPTEKARPFTLPSSLCKSFKLDLSFLPRKLSYPRLYDKGLICFRSEPSKEEVISLCVCNPMTKTWKELPDFSTNQAQQLRMAMVQDGTSSYKIVVLHGDVVDQGELNRNQSMWTIRSCAGTPQGNYEWKVSRADPPCPLLTRSTFALCQGRLYILVFGIHLLLYTIDGRLVDRFDVNNPCMHHAAHRLVEHQGNVLLCGHFRCGLSQLTIRIWKLDQKKLVFEQVSALPDRQISELLQGWDMTHADVELLDCLTIGDFICLHLEIYNLINGVVRNLVLAFHYRDSSWRLLAMDYLPYKSLTLFEPKLDLFV